MSRWPLADLVGHRLGTCLGCKRRAEERRGIWCSDCGAVFKRDVPRALELAARGELGDYRVVSIDDPVALAAAQDALAECASKKILEWRHSPYARRICYEVRWVDVGGGEVLVWLDCLGYSDVPYVARGLAVCWAPLAAAPAYRRRRPLGERPMHIEESLASGPPPNLWQRLADGFAMMDGYEGAVTRRGDLRQ